MYDSFNTDINIKINKKIENIEIFLNTSFFKNNETRIRIKVPVANKNSGKTNPQN